MKKETSIWHDGPESTQPGQIAIGRGSRKFQKWFENFFSLDLPHYEEVKAFAPPYDITENPDHFLMCLDVPGLIPEQIQVQIVGDELAIAGERGVLGNERGGFPFRGKPRYGKFRRSFTLPPLAAFEKVRANYQNGVLEVLIPKRLSGLQVIRIPVESNAHLDFVASRECAA